MTPLHSSSSSNRPVKRSTPCQQPEVKDPSSKRAQSKERGDSKGKTKKRAKLIVSHPYEMNLTVKEKAARVAVVLSPIQKCGYQEGCEKPSLERNNGLCGSHCNIFIRGKDPVAISVLLLSLCQRKGQNFANVSHPFAMRLGIQPVGAFLYRQKRKKTDITNGTAASTCPSEKERHQKCTSDLEVAVRNHEHVAVEKQVRMKEAESKLQSEERDKEIAILKKANEERDEEIATLKMAKEELTQKTMEQAASFVESESRREQLKSTFKLKCEKLLKANAYIQ
eukprot:scaffold43752_cov51-Attheya_sp.AAC.7